MVWSCPDSQVPLIGASGAIAGVVAAYLVLHPRVKVWVLAFARIPLRIPGLHRAGALDPVPVRACSLSGGEDQISWACHVGGIIAGAVLVLILKRPRRAACSTARSSRPRAVAVEQHERRRAAAEPAPAPRWGRQ